MTPRQLRDAANGPWEPKWIPCFICRETVEVPAAFESEHCLVVCGECRKKAYEMADKLYPLVPA